MLVYFMTIWYNLWSFGTGCGHLVYFYRFGFVWTNENLAKIPTQKNLCSM
jgi:hypothetical protein